MAATSHLGPEKIVKVVRLKFNFREKGGTESVWYQMKAMWRTYYKKMEKAFFLNSRYLIYIRAVQNK